MIPGSSEQQCLQNAQFKKDKICFLMTFAQDSCYLFKEKWVNWSNFVDSIFAFLQLHWKSCLPSAPSLHMQSTEKFMTFRQGGIYLLFEGCRELLTLLILKKVNGQYSSSCVQNEQGRATQGHRKMILGMVLLW